jgi:hypothetical protein
MPGRLGTNADGRAARRPFRLRRGAQGSPGLAGEIALRLPGGIAAPGMDWDSGGRVTWPGASAGGREGKEGMARTA